MFSTKTETVRLLIGVVVGLILLKLAVSWLTGSISIFLSRHLLKVSRATSSVALEANARNIATDVYLFEAR